jgi:hypothetical protein
LSAFPWIEGGSIGRLGPLPVAAKKAGGLQLGMHIHGPDRSDEDVVGQSVAPMPASAATTSQTVMTILRDLYPTDAAMRPHEGCSDAQADGDPQFLVALATIGIIESNTVSKAVRTKCTYASKYVL